MIELRAVDANAFTFVRPSAEYNPALRHPQTASITVNYSGFTPQAQAAFEYAVDIWEAQLTSPVQIVVNASWEPLGQGVLGSAGPAGLVANWSGNGINPPPRQDTFYPVALANKIAGTDLAPANPDIVARFSSAYPNWHFGTDGNPPANTYDFVSVVLHELGHGLGFVGSARVQSGQGALGFNPQNSTALWPGIYDIFIETGEGQALWNLPNPSAQLAAEFTSNDLFVDSPSTVAILGGNRPRIYAPGQFSQGTSYSHWDEDTYPPGNPDSLMTGFLSSAEAIHDPGSLTRAFLQDMGWGIEAPPPTSTPTVTQTSTPRPPGERSLFLPMVRRASPTPPPTPTFTPTIMPSATASATLVPPEPQGIVNGDFEAGAAGWIHGSNLGYATILPSSEIPVPPHSGSWAVWLGGAYDDISIVRQQVTVSAQRPYLVYWHWIASEDDCGSDFGGVVINESVVVEGYELCNARNTNGWLRRGVDLSAYAGQTVWVEIRAETDDSLNSNLFVDDVSLEPNLLVAATEPPSASENEGRLSQPKPDHLDSSRLPVPAIRTRLLGQDRAGPR
jgi:hypothetical protein